jgi:ABC-2 type transport system ATP-binding protein
VEVLEARGVAKRWGATLALADVSFTVGRGVTGLLGANGAGKTTLLGMMLGLHRPDDGALRVLGLDPADAGPEVRAQVGYSPEHHNVPPDMRAHDFVRHLAEVHGLPKREATSRAAEALWLVGLGEERFRPLGTMSTGQRQRVKLAQAIAHDPRLVLLDEPTDGLDPVQRDEMLALIRRIGTEFGIDVVLSSHLLDEVERVCDHAVILHEGIVVTHGAIADLLRGAEGLVVEVDDDPAPVAAALSARGVQVTGDGHTLHLSAGGSAEQNGDLLAIATAVLADGQVAVRKLHAERRSLHDVFIGVTG